MKPALPLPAFLTLIGAVLLLSGCSSPDPNKGHQTSSVAVYQTDTGSVVSWDCELDGEITRLSAISSVTPSCHKGELVNVRTGPMILGCYRVQHGFFRWDFVRVPCSNE